MLQERLTHSEEDMQKNKSRYFPLFHHLTLDLTLDKLKIIIKEKYKKRKIIFPLSEKLYGKKLQTTFN